MRGIYGKSYRWVCAILVIALFMSILPLNIVMADVSNIFFENTIRYSKSGNENAGSFSDGSTGVDLDITSLKIKYDNSYSLVSEDALNRIVVRANNRALEKDEVQIKSSEGVLTFNLKDYKLQENTLYTIYIPGWTFKYKNAEDYNTDKYFSFVTKIDKSEQDNSLLEMQRSFIKKVSVGNKVILDKEIIQKAIKDQVNKGLKNDEGKGKIIIEFADDIELNPDAIDNYEDYIEITTDPIVSSLPAYDNTFPYHSGDYIGAYKIYTEGNKLVLEPRYGLLRDFANYNVKIKSQAVYLRNAYFGDDQTPRIYNEQYTISFDTANMLAATFPVNNSEKVEVEPVIRFHFKYPVKILDSSMVEISEGGTNFSVDSRYNVFLSTETGNDKILIVNINDLENTRPYRLRKNTLYRITLKVGAVALKDYEDVNGGDVENNLVNLYFVTGGDGQAPVITGYSSDAGNSDDIRYLSHEEKDAVQPEDKVTNLDADGSVYIHFDRPIRADKQTEFLSLFDATHLYKMPRADSIKYDDNGRMYDDTVSFKPYTYLQLDGTEKTVIVPGNLTTEDDIFFANSGAYYEEIAVGSVEIISNNILKVTPKFKLDNLNKYKLTIDKRVIEDYNGYNIDENIDFQFWTKAAGNEITARWKAPDQNTAQNIIENNDMPYKGFTLAGVPRYSADLPIVLNLDNEVIVKAEDELIKQTPDDIKDVRALTFKALEEIVFEDGYNTAAASLKKVAISKYKFEYYFEDGVKKTKLYLYPKDTLGYGRYYRLKVPEGVLITRSGYKVSTLEVNFITEGNVNQIFGIYQLQDNAAKVTDVWQKGEWAFKLLGFNFHEYMDDVNYSIGKIELYTNTKSISIAKQDIEFVNATEMRVKIRGNNATLFSQEAYTGQYDIRVYYRVKNSNGEFEESFMGFNNPSSYIEREVVIEGRDFRPDIKEVTLKRVGTTDQVTIEPEDVQESIQYVNSKKLIIKLRGTNALTTAAWGASAKYEVVVEYEKEINLSGITDTWKYELYGSGFNNPVYQVIFRPILGKAISLPKDEQEIIMGPEGIEAESDTKLAVNIGKTQMDKLKDPARAGTYKVTVKFASALNRSDYISTATIAIDEQGKAILNEKVDITDPLDINGTVTMPSRLQFELISKGRPKVVAQFPYPLNSGKWSDEMSMTHEVQDLVTANRYFIKITFEDIDGKLTFDKTNGISLLKDSSTVYGQGSANSMIDTDFLVSIMNRSTVDRDEMIDKYLLTKNRAKREAYLYIPVRLLQSALTYDVTIVPGVVCNDAADGKSDSIIWRFITTAKPFVTRINTGSIAEDYGKDQAVIITGSNFYKPSIKVFFNNVEAVRVVLKVNTSGQQYLEAYLPTDKSRLAPGVYSITVKNDANHERVSYGAFSVVKKGEYVPNEDTGFKGKSGSGDVTYSYRVSEDTLELNTAYSNTRHISLKLDEIMGEDVWTRKIKFKGNTRYTIDKLETLSKWSNVTFFDLTLDPGAESREIVLKLGRAEPALSQSIKSKLGSKLIKSDMIQVTGQNFTVIQMDVVIPYKNSDGNTLKVMRYDEASRGWVQEEGTVNKMEKVVRISTYKTGIFVIVE